jgi:retron-type reverse transcriptase
MLAAETKKCPRDKLWSHTPLHSASVYAGHKIQQRQQVEEARKFEAVMQPENEAATSCRPPVSQLQQLRQQQAERQRQQQERQPARNDSGLPLGKKTYKSLFPALCEYNNLMLAFIKARKHKTKKEYVKKFESNLNTELLRLQWELLTGTYHPAQLTTFTVRDPKTRKISASHFRDRVVHHAICNIIEPIFENRFIFDSFANRKGKGTSGIIKRFDKFIQKNKNGYALKADIRHYFDTVNHEVLLGILGRRIKDEQLLSLITSILQNYKTKTPGIGMPLGNLTSQFFANVYLAELDNFVKHELKAKHYVRYVDDFVILNKNKKQLEAWKNKINVFLSSKLKLTLHPDKTSIIPINAGVPLVGFRVFPTHKLLKKSNLRRFRSRLDRLKEGLKNGTMDKEHVSLSLAGWNGYAKMANTAGLREEINQEIASWRS